MPHVCTRSPPPHLGNWETRVRALRSARTWASVRRRRAAALRRASLNAARSRVRGTGRAFNQLGRSGNRRLFARPRAAAAAYLEDRLGSRGRLRAAPRWFVLWARFGVSSAPSCVCVCVPCPREPLSVAAGGNTVRVERLSHKCLRGRSVTRYNSGALFLTWKYVQIQSSTRVFVP